MTDCNKQFDQEEFEESTLIVKQDGGFKINKKDLVRFKYYMIHKHNKILSYQELKKAYVKWIQE